MKFIFTCGGTAGHINPALAVASKLREILPSCDILFIGASGKMETELVPLAGFEIKEIKITNISRGHNLKSLFHNIITVFNVFFSTIRALKTIHDFKPDCVIGTGGYVCFPVLKAAHILHIKTVIHESNAYPGLTTRLISKDVDRILTGFNCRYFSNDPRAIVVGTPVRKEFSELTKEQAKRELGIDKPIVLSVMGSLGAEHMNSVISDMISKMGYNPDFHLIHVTGSSYFNDFEPKYSDVADIYEYIHDIAKYMCASDIIICRAGASTLSEITYLGKPSILIPSPNVTENHQEKNARLLEEGKAAFVLLEDEFNSDLLLEKIEMMLSDNDLLLEMSEASKSFSNDNSCDDIVKSIFECLEC